MTYAPICIPTLNRYEHLRKCLESLSQCTLADQTEVYVALDYPPQNQWDKYAPGWEKNREWLHSVGDMGFKKLHLIERDTNYGIWTNPAGKKTNLRALLEECIYEKYESYICTEDDNVFAPAFLEYMNKGIEKYKDDMSVYGICGYRHPYPIKYDSNTFFRQSNDYSAWGVAVLPNRNFVPDYKWFRKKLSIHTLKEFRKHGRYRLAGFIKACEKKQGYYSMIDNGVSIVAPLLKMDFIMPTQSLVRNIGADGSGINFSSQECELNKVLMNQPISDAKSFDFIGTGYEYYDENKTIYAKSSWGEISTSKLIEIIIKSIIKRIVIG